MKKKLSEEDIINWWLEKYHNTNIEKVLKKHPEWADGNHSRDFYDAYRVTQEQHDEWHEWMIKALMKEFGCKKKYAKKASWVLYLNTAPSVIISPKEDTPGQPPQ